MGDNSSMSTARPRPLLALSLALVLAGCGADDADETATPTASPLASPSSTAPAGGGTTPSPAETGEPPEQDAPFVADLQDDTAPAEGGGLAVVDVRIGEHDGYDRVVFELDGDGTAGWRVGYDDAPAHQGSGDPVTLDGDATLSVVLEGMGYPDETGLEYYDDAERFAPAYPAVLEVELGGMFEGYYDAFVGVREALPFRVFRLDDPQRVVLDVTHQG